MAWRLPHAALTLALVRSQMVGVPGLPFEGETTTMTVQTHGSIDFHDLAFSSPSTGDIDGLLDLYVSNQHIDPIDCQDVPFHLNVSLGEIKRTDTSQNSCVENLLRAHKCELGPFYLINGTIVVTGGCEISLGFFGHYMKVSDGTDRPMRIYTNTDSYSCSFHTTSTLR